jgi:hypothetical protein
MKQKRNTLGRFEKNDSTAEEYQEVECTFRIPAGWSTRIILLIVGFFLISPWLFMITKKKSLTGISEKVTDFYDGYFSCSCPNITCPEATGTQNPSLNNNKDKTSL